MAKKKSEESKAGCPEYMLTYGDMMTLLLCFFVLLFSFSTIEKKEFQHVMSAFKDAIGVLPGAVALEDGTGKMQKTNIMIHYKKGTESKRGADTITPTSNDAKFVAEMVGALEKQEKKGDIEIILNEHGLILRIKGRLVFEQGSAHLSEKMVELLSRVAEILNQGDYAGRLLLIEGHTDNLLVRSLDYPSNWELSCHRAINVARYLTEVEKENRINPDRIRVVGRSMYRPVAVNEPDKGNPENRRVEIIVVPRSQFEGESSTGNPLEFKNHDFQMLNED